VKQSEEDEEETLELEAKRLNSAMDSRDMSAGRCHLAAGLGQAMWGG